MRSLLDRKHRDDRLELILVHLRALENSGPAVKNIISEVEELRNYLTISDAEAQNYELRISSLMEVLLKYTVMDFRTPAMVSELGDDLDAIAVGVNTLAEELQFRVETEIRNAERLHEQNVKLERINKELASFAYVSSHDLQEPLRKISTYISRLLDEDINSLPEQMRFYFTRIATAAAHMQNLIRDILEYSKLSSTEEEVEYANLEELTNDVREEFTESLNERSARLNVELNCHARIIPFQYKRLLGNLLSNSLKFYDHNRPLKIDITAEKATGSELREPSLTASKNYIHIRYSDTGIGFNPQYSEKIFEVFQRLHNQTEYTGTGVGLSICKRIVENHGGAIRATGETGKGATFHIFLPAS